MFAQGYGLTHAARDFVQLDNTRHIEQAVKWFVRYGGVEKAQRIRPVRDAVESREYRGNNGPERD